MQRVRVGSGELARVGPALFITKLIMTYAAFTRYFTRPYLYVVGPSGTAKIGKCCMNGEALHLVNVSPIPVFAGRSTMRESSRCILFKLWPVPREAIHLPPGEPGGDSWAAGPLDVSMRLHTSTQTTTPSNLPIPMIRISSGRS